MVYQIPIQQKRDGTKNLIFEPSLQNILEYGRKVSPYAGVVIIHFSPVKFSVGLTNVPLQRQPLRIFSRPCFFLHNFLFIPPLYYSSADSYSPSRSRYRAEAWGGGRKYDTFWGLN